MNVVYPSTLSESQTFAAVDLVYNFYAALFFSCYVFRRGAGEEWRSAGPIV